MVSEDFLPIFYESMGANHPQVCSGQFEPQGNRLQRVGWIYVVSHYALLHTKYKSYWLYGFPIIRKLMTDPHGMAKLDPKGMVGTIYAGDHKTLLYTKCINYGPHRKDFKKILSMRAVDRALGNAELRV